MAGHTSWVGGPLVAPNSVCQTAGVRSQGHHWRPRNIVAATGPVNCHHPNTGSAAVLPVASTPALEAYSHDPGLFFSVLKVASRLPPKQTLGPGTALAGALSRIHATISPEGTLKLPDNGRVELEYCTKKQLIDAVTRAWAHHVQQAVSHRTGLASVGSPDVRITDSVFRTLTPSEQAVFARHVCGGFSSGAAKAKWAADEDGTCPLCGAMDDKRHRLLHCPATEKPPYGVEPPNAEVPRLIFATRSLPPLPSLAEADALRLPSGGQLTLFTDGSCRNPSILFASIAAFAVVQDMSRSPSHIPAFRSAWQVSGIVPPLLHVVTQGSVPGEQTINRAEFCAVIQACCHAVRLGAPATTIWTDSTFVMAEWERGRNGKEFHYRDLGYLLTTSWRSQFDLRKVKAHENLENLAGLEWWRAAGSLQADLASKAAVRNDYGFLLEMVDNMAEQDRLQRDLLLLFTRFLVALSQRSLSSKRRYNARKLQCMWSHWQTLRGNRLRFSTGRGYSSSRCHLGSPAFQSGNATGLLLQVGRRGSVRRFGVGR